MKKQFYVFAETRETTRQENGHIRSVWSIDLIFDNFTDAFAKYLFLNPPTVEPGLEVAMKLYDSGYFTEKESVAFGDALSKLIKTSNPTRKRKDND